jgi:hypothetical protein
MIIMGKRGPAPAPTAVRLLRGDRKDRVNFDEPMPAVGHSRAAVVAVGRRPIDLGWLAPDLERRGVLTVWDVEAFANNCDAAARRRRAVARLEAEGEVVEQPVMDHGRAVAVRLSRNPWVLILSEADVAPCILARCRQRSLNRFQTLR